MIKILVGIALTFSISAHAVAPEIHGIRTAELRPALTPIADILYIHGYGDRFENHGSLFKAWADAGFRIITFDLPSHGESEESLDSYTFGRLAKLVRHLERETREDKDRPLFLAGWSTGGLIAVRTVQAKSFPKMKRKVSGLILITPGIAVRFFVGEWGVITERTLSSNPNPQHRREPSPVSPFLTPLFSMNMFFLNSPLAYYQSMPKDIPMLVFTADDQMDRYAVPEKTREWVIDQRNNSSVKVIGVECPNARHELDNELQPSSSPVGEEVIETSVMFAKIVVAKFDPTLAHYTLKSCKRF